MSDDRLDLYRASKRPLYGSFDDILDALQEIFSYYDPKFYYFEFIDSNLVMLYSDPLLDRLDDPWITAQYGNPNRVPEALETIKTTKAGPGRTELPHYRKAMELITLGIPKQDVFNKLMQNPKFNNGTELRPVLQKRFDEYIRRKKKPTKP